jgi:hypothetical protein
MASVVLSGDTSGSVTLAAPTISGTTTQTLVAVSGTLAPVVSGTAVASTSGTSIDFTSLPSWVKRITVMFNGVSTNGTSAVQIQLGAGSVTTSGYVSGSTFATTTVGPVSSTTGLVFIGTSTSNIRTGLTVITNITGNTWVSASNGTLEDVSSSFCGGGKIALGGTLDRVRITTVNGTDAFDAGSINILYE